MLSKPCRGRLIDDFVRWFNKRRLQTSSPSDFVCLDESMSKWYGAGGHWINEGLPVCVGCYRSEARERLRNTKQRARAERGNVAVEAGDHSGVQGRTR
jgi:hypothetical protein